jgi:hypothetical protein
VDERRDRARRARPVHHRHRVFVRITVPRVRGLAGSRVRDRRSTRVNEATPNGLLALVTNVFELANSRARGANPRNLPLLTERKKRYSCPSVTERKPILAIWAMQ